ncbi:hypothetical protein KCV05_g9016, partial [Aureobasidium melanogenum]
MLNILLPGLDNPAAFGQTQLPGDWLRITRKPAAIKSCAQVILNGHSNLPSTAPQRERLGVIQDKQLVEVYYERVASILEQHKDMPSRSIRAYDTLS